MLLRRPIAATILILAVLIFGYLALRNLSIDLLPSVDVPSLLVRTEWEGSSARDVELRITEPLEAILSSVPNLRNTRSVTKQGISLIVLEFDWGQDMNMAFLNVREKLDLIRYTLPESAKRPVLIHTDPSDEPVAVLTVSSKDQSDPDLATRLEIKRWTDQVLSRRLEQVDGIARAIMVGAVEPEVRIRIREQEAARYGLRPSEIRARVSEANQFSQSGQLSDGWYRYSLKIESRINSIDEIRRIPLLTLNDTRILRLGDVADVDLAERDPSSFSMVDGKDVLSVLVKKDYGANQVQVYNALIPLLEEVRIQHPGIAIDIIRENATAIEAIIQNLLQTLIVGGILAFLVLFFFLNDVRIPFTIGVAIPVSIFMTFFVMYLLGIQLNVISLSGLTLGIGLLVDNAIVVLENINRYRMAGESVMEAARKGTREIALPVTASTFTTISVFLPLVFLGGFEGVLFRDQAATLSISLLASLLVALTVLPVLVTMVQSKREDTIIAKKSPTLGMMTRLQDSYEVLLTWSLSRPYLSWMVLCLGFALGLVLFMTLPKSVLPTTDPQQLHYRISLPSNSSLATTRLASKTIQDEFLMDPSFKKILVMGGYSDQTNLNTLVEEGPNRYTITIPVRDAAHVQKTQTAFSEIQNRFPDWTVESLDQEGLFSGFVQGSGSAFRFYVVGQNREESAIQAQILSSSIQAIKADFSAKLISDKLVDVYEVRFKPERLLEYSISEQEIISWLESMARGNLLTEWNREEESIGIRMYRSAETVFDPGTLRYTDQRRSIQLSQIADIVTMRESEQLERIGQSPVLGYTTSLTMADWWWEGDQFAENILDFSRSTGVTVISAGAAQQVADLLRRMGNLLALSILLIYIILAIQYEHLIYPILIVCSIPFAWIGALVFLTLGAASLNTLSFLGILVLTGIAVNDAILKVDFMKRYLEEHDHVTQAITEAGKHRFRPVMMTTLTTILGLIPMLLPIGEGYELRQALGLALAGGMISSTILTLFIIPLLFRWIHRKHPSLTLKTD
jgi:hydrophobic/amphiphilic exporter-1 (mainly G- bacteria), HAE1 family